MSLIKQRIQYLVNQCLENLQTVEEREELNQYLSSQEYEELVNEIVEQSFFSNTQLIDISSDKSDAIFESIIYSKPPVKQIHSTRFSYRKWASIAALLILIISPVLVLMPSLTFKEIVKNVIVFSVKERDVNNIDDAEKALPAEDKAILTTTEGDVIKLDEIPIGKSITIGDMEMEKMGLANISFHFKEKHQSSRNTINTLVTPRGSRYKVTLSDGSVVELNAGSRLTFPTYFVGNERRLSLEGEGFFDVAHDSVKRFIVRVSTPTQQQDVFVYGTKFNINAYATSDGIMTTLVEGSVKIKSSVLEQELKPMQQTLFKEGKMILSPANLDMNLAWKNELFYFEDELIESVMQEISRWYDVDIIYNGDTPAIKIWGQLSREKGLSEILDILSKTNDLKFKVSGKEVYVME